MMTGQDGMAKRRAAFQLGEAELAALRRNAGFAEKRLPELLAAWHSRFAQWPEIQAALMNPAVHAVRVDHWARVASGRIDAEFTRSAKRLAQAFYDHGVPGYAVAICHHTVSEGIAAELGLDADTGLFGGARRRENEALRAALSKVAWFDLELLLETYAEAERASKRAVLEALADEFERGVKGMVESAAAASTQMQGNARRMADIAVATSRQSVEVGAAAEQASVNVQTVASASEQLTASIGEINGHVARSSRIAAEAVAEAEATNATVAGLVEAAQRIGEVVKLINDIASQTNLLALNATIEAARAGEAGKGFAVVASEVKNLANQTAKATEDIGQQIAAMQTAARGSADAIKGVGETITRIDGIIATIAGAMDEQAGATREIAHSVNDAAAGAQSVTRTIGAVTQGSAETGSIAAEVLSAANLMREQADTLHASVDSFLRNVRAA